MPKQRSHSMRIGMQCWHCGCRAHQVASVVLSPVVSEITYGCSNSSCGHVFVATATAIRSQRPSRKPNPEVRLPFFMKTGRRVPFFPTETGLQSKGD